MPELPEVETVRRGLEPFFEDATITSVELRRPDLRFPFPEGFIEILTGAKVTALARRAKYLLIHLQSGPVIISHLGMSGSFRIEEQDSSQIPGDFHRPRDKNAAHDHVLIALQSPSKGRVHIIYNDPRRFGFMLLTDEAHLNEHPMLKRIGTEPTGNSLDGKLLAKLMAGKQTPLKTALLDQSLIAGLGNIYVCEALWRAKLSPRRLAGTIAGAGGRATKRSTELAESIRNVIAEAIIAGGSSLRDHRQADGSLGYFQHSFSVYDREGEPCPRIECSGTINRITQAGRSTFFCPQCQR